MTYDIQKRIEKVKTNLKEEYKAIENDMPEIQERSNADSHIFIGWLEALDFALEQIKEQLDNKEEIKNA